jgi:hypothetical protein
MELSGALWNLYVQGRLPRLAALHKRLLARTPETGVVGRPIRRRQGALLEAVTTVLELAGCPLRMREVHAAVEELYGERVPFSSVNEALSTHALTATEAGSAESVTAPTPWQDDDQTSPANPKGPPGLGTDLPPPPREARQVAAYARDVPGLAAGVRGYACGRGRA